MAGIFFGNMRLDGGQVSIHDGRKLLALFLETRTRVRSRIDYHKNTGMSRDFG